MGPLGRGEGGTFDSVLRTSASEDLGKNPPLSRTQSPPYWDCQDIGVSSGSRKVLLPQVKLEAKTDPELTSRPEALHVLGGKLSHTTVGFTHSGEKARQTELSILPMGRQAPGNGNRVTVPGRGLLRSTGLPLGHCPSRVQFT